MPATLSADPLRKRAWLEALREEIAALEGPAAAGSGVRLGAGPADRALGGGLSRHGLHEIAAATYPDLPASRAFAAGLAARFLGEVPGRPLLWIEWARAPFDVGRLYGPGLAAFGIEPDRLILAEVHRAAEALWCLEEALRSGTLAALIGEIDPASPAFSLSAARRLQLAAEESATPLLLLTGPGGGTAGMAAALTRWQISTAPGGMTRSGRPGAPGFDASLLKCRQGRPGRWTLYWDGAGFTADRPVVSPFAPLAERVAA